MIGKTISHYKILEKLGSGGMGIVYKAQDLKLDRFVALKFLPPHLTTSDENKQRFIHEAKAASALQHNNICAIHEINETVDGQLFISMDYYEGETLDKRIKDKPLAIDDAIDIAIQVAQGLAKAHEKEIVHRDIKPANIMRTADGVVKILDFGLAKLSTQTKLTKDSSSLGTVSYMSPEQTKGETVDYRTDIWSFGVVMYEMFSGQLPFKGEYDSAVIYSIMNDQPQSPRQIRLDLPAALDAMIMKMLIKQPEKRYQSMPQIIDELSTSGKTDQRIHKKHNWLASLKRPIVFGPLIIVLIILAFLTGREINQYSDSLKINNQLIPQLKKTIEESDPFNTTAAFQLAQNIEQIQPDHPELTALLPELSVKVTIKTDPPGALISIKPDKDPETEWQKIGFSPIKETRLPKSFFRLQVEKEGYHIVKHVFHTWVDSVVIILDSVGTIPRDMVRIPETNGIADFYIDMYEVTNREYKRFIEAGGYRNQEFWKFPIEDNGKNIPWANAIQRFVDQTGRNGPSTWYAGDYKENQAEYPVSGICWYEAAAYAAFAGKSLPTDQHWYVASGQAKPTLFYFHNSHFISSSNFSETGLEAVGRRNVINAYGLYDVAGNVREWCFNKSEKGRILRGGAWNDAAYMFNNRTQASALDRSAKNGFRCVTYLQPEKIDKELFAPVTSITPSNYGQRKPVTDDIFAVYRQLYAYDHTDLEIQIEDRDDGNDNWIMEKISINAAYENDRLTVYFFSPRNKQPPFQTILYFPGAHVMSVTSSNQMTSLPEFKKHVKFLLKSGRAVAFPVYYGTFERDTEIWDRISSSTHPHQHAQLRIKIIKDVKRSLDYLCSRSDVDSNRIGYFGFSWGGAYAPLSLATDQRLKAAVLKVGGYYIYSEAREEVQQYNYTPRVNIPVLMLNGFYDAAFSAELSVKPMFTALGTDPKYKKLIIYPTADHWIPQNELVKETLAWYDNYLGIVEN